MELIKDLTLMESQRRADLEVGYAIDAVNDIYNEWKKRGRRRNAANIVTTSINKLTTIDPATVDQVHDTARTKMAVVIMRCLDIPPWMDVENKRIAYRRLFPIIDKLQRVSPNTGTGGSLSDVITTRLSAAVCSAVEDPKESNIFVAYEPSISRKYMRHLFGDEQPEHVVKMQTLSLPKDFDTLINIIKINHGKACEKYNGKKEE